MEKNELLEELFEVREKIVDLRDNQDVISCDESKNDICNFFDQVLDALDNLAIKINDFKEE